jgi:hypothetical protein
VKEKVRFKANFVNSPLSPLQKPRLAFAWRADDQGDEKGVMEGVGVSEGVGGVKLAVGVKVLVG